ncbi:MAG TPA: hypothetical protein DFR83_12165 [Deltaproteobacteria bacterium]|nr:hypothetical protein [Deltaproteobacteria bacterium]
MPTPSSRKAATSLHSPRSPYPSCRAESPCGLDPSTWSATSGDPAASHSGWIRRTPSKSATKPTTATTSEGGPVTNRIGITVLLTLGCSSEPLTVDRKSAASAELDTSDTSGAPLPIDTDGDGFTSDEDCDDTDPAISPAADEVCNGRDDNCDGNIDEGLATATWFLDADSDGFGSLDEIRETCAPPSGFVGNDWDCDDTAADVHPGAEEVCSGPDRDCGGLPPAPCRTCRDILENGASIGDGIYTIEPDSLGLTSVWCDMNIDGGGWTLLQRTVWDWADSSQLLTSYADWYTTTVGSPSDGSAFRIAGRGWPELAQGQEHLLVLVPRDADSGGSCDAMVYKGTGGRVLVSSYAAYVTGLQSDVSIVNGDTLSATDHGPSQSCVSNHAVPWFYASCCATCPTYQGGYWSDSPHPMASYTTTVPDLAGRLAADVCGAGGPLLASGGDFVGMMEMAYFVR